MDGKVSFKERSNNNIAGRVSVVIEGVECKEVKVSIGPQSVSKRIIWLRLSPAIAAATLLPVKNYAQFKDGTEVENLLTDFVSSFYFKRYQ